MTIDCPRCYGVGKLPYLNLRSRRRVCIDCPKCDGAGKLRIREVPPELAKLEGAWMPLDRAKRAIAERRAER